MNEPKPISFAQKVKEEAISNLDWSDNEKKCLLSSFVRLNGYASLDMYSLKLHHESAQVAKKIYEIIHTLYGLDAHFAYTRNSSFNKNIVYHIEIDKGAKAMLDDLEIDYLDPIFPKDFIKKKQGEGAYLSGAFLASGSVNDPRSSNYHLEISLNDESYAKSLLSLWKKAKYPYFEPKMVKRRNSYVLYLKKAMQIQDFLIMIGAKESCLEFIDIMSLRDLNNNGNRLMNIDAANVSKTLKASERQIKEIQYFLEYPCPELSNPKIQALIEIRLNNPESSLDALSILLSEELSSEVSKSNVNHIFRKIHEEYVKRHKDD